MKMLRDQGRLIVSVALLAVTVIIWYGVAVESADDTLTVAYLDVGQGDAIFIESPTGVQVLVDGGATRRVLRELSRVMPFYDRSIDVVVATHPDQDHIGGLIDVLRGYEIETILRSGALTDTDVFSVFNDTIKDERAHVLIARRGMAIDLGGGAIMNILFPDRDVSALDPNDASIIAEVVYGDTEFLLTGDAPASMEEYVASLDTREIKTNVLKAGHHGSNTSSSALFLGFADPDVVVISAGKNNRYGHPHSEVIDRLNAFQIPYLSTADEGTIIFESDGRSILRK